MTNMVKMAKSWQKCGKIKAKSWQYEWLGFYRLIQVKRKKVLQYDFMIIDRKSYFYPLFN